MNNENLDPNMRCFLSPTDVGIQHSSSKMTSLSQFRSQDLVFNHEESVDEDMQRLQEEEEIDRGVTEKICGAFEGVDLNLECDSDDDDDNVLTAKFQENVNAAENIREIQPESVIADQTIASETELEKLRVLYGVRGDRIIHLEKEIEYMQSNLSADVEMLKTENKDVTDEKEMLNGKCLEMQHMLDASIEMRREAERQKDEFRTQLARAEDTNRQMEIDLVEERMKNSVLQNKLDSFLQSQTVLKAQAHHDQVIQSLQSKHGKQVDILQAKLAERQSEINRMHLDMLDLRRQLDTEHISNREAITDRDLTIVALQQKVADLEMKHKEVEKALSQSVNNDICPKCGEMAIRLAECTSKLNELSKTKESLKTSPRSLTSAVESELAASESREAVSRLQTQLDAVSAQLSTVREERQRLTADLERAEGSKLEQEAQMDSCIAQWHDEIESIKRNHGLDRLMLNNMTEKYKSLKSRIRDYQKRVRNRDADMRCQIAKLQAFYAENLTEYRDKLQEAYSIREKEVENDLMSMRTLFVDEMQKMRENSKGQVTSNSGELQKQLQSELKVARNQLQQRHLTPESDPSC